MKIRDYFQLASNRRYLNVPPMNPLLTCASQCLVETMKPRVPQVAKSPMHLICLQFKHTFGTVGQENTGQSTSTERGQLTSCEAKVTLAVISPVRSLLFPQSRLAQGFNWPGRSRCSPCFRVAQQTSSRHYF